MFRRLKDNLYSLVEQSCSNRRPSVLSPKDPAKCGILLLGGEVKEEHFFVRGLSPCNFYRVAEHMFGSEFLCKTHALWEPV